MKLKRLEISLILSFAVIFITSFLLTTFFPTGYIRGGDYEYLLTILLSFGLLLWGISMIYRSQFKKQRRYIIILVFTFFFWIILRFIKWLPNIHYVSIYADYLYYVPMMVVPIIFLMMTIDTFFLDFKRKNILYLVISIIAILLVLFALTNELHFLVYRNYQISYGEDPHIEIIKSEYGPLHYVSLGYVGLLTLGSFVTFLLGSRKQLSFKQILIVSISTIALVTYIALFTIGLLSKTPILRDFATCIAILLTILLETLLDIGLIQNNGKYTANFLKASVGIAIYDENKRVIYQTSAFDEKKDDISISEKEIGKYSIKTIEDLKSIHQLQEQIKNEIKEIELINDSLTKLIEISKSEASIKYRLSLINEIEESITTSKQEIISLAESLPDQVDKTSKEKLSYIELLLGYTKQKCMLLLRAKEETSLNYESFSLLIKVISEDIKCVGYDDVAINILSKDDISVLLATKYNDFIHLVAKAYRFSHSTLLFFIDQNKNNCKVQIIKKHLKYIDFDCPFGKLSHKDSDEGITLLWEGNNE